jgi:hypothetical protein
LSWQSAEQLFPSGEVVLKAPRHKLFCVEIMLLDFSQEHFVRLYGLWKKSRGLILHFLQRLADCKFERFLRSLFMRSDLKL